MNCPGNCCWKEHYLEVDSIRAFPVHSTSVPLGIRSAIRIYPMIFNVELTSNCIIIVIQSFLIINYIDLYSLKWKYNLLLLLTLIWNLN